jgi:hypothetical protein
VARTRLVPGCSNSTYRFVAVATNNDHDHAPVAAIVDVSGWMRAHDVGFRARWKLLADVGNQLPRTQNYLLDGVRLVGLRRKVLRKTENPDNDKKNSSLHFEYLLSARK